jgi:cell division protein FtsZ
MILFEEQEKDQTTDLPIRLDEQANMAPAKIRVVGVGGGGGNAVNRMIDSDLKGIEFLAANTDLQALRKCRAETKLQLGLARTRGLGAGGDPTVGRESALEDTEHILQLLEGSDMVFLTAGLGGGTGTGALPIIASLAAEIGALTVAVVTRPFAFEGKRRGELAMQGLDELSGAVDTVISIPNERLLNFVDPGTPLSEAFRIADDVLRQAVQGISDLIIVPGEINVDFADVRTIMSGMGMALMGTGIAKGDTRALEAAQRAISSPLLEDTSIEGAKGVLINISGGRDLTLHEVAEAAQVVSEAVDNDANIISGMVIDEDMEDEMKVTVIATGFHQHSGPSYVRPTHQVAAPVSEPMFDSMADPMGDPMIDPTADPLGEPIRDAGGIAPETAQVDLEPIEEQDESKVPFYKKVLAHHGNSDSGSFGPNWSGVDDFDIPTVLRKNMD